MKKTIKKSEKKTYTLSWLQKLGITKTNLLHKDKIYWRLCYLNKKIIFDNNYVKLPKGNI